MKKIFAIVNHGRWIAICPECQKEGRIAATAAKEGEAFVCPEEYPGVRATAMSPHGSIKGAFTAIPDEAARAKARKQAEHDGKAYEVVFPREKANIERALRARPVSARNWDLDETADDLLRENAERGVRS